MSSEGGVQLKVAKLSTVRIEADGTSSASLQ